MMIVFCLTPDKVVQSNKSEGGQGERLQQRKEALSQVPLSLSLHADRRQDNGGSYSHILRAGFKSSHKVLCIGLFRTQRLIFFVCPFPLSLDKDTSLQVTVPSRTVTQRNSITILVSLAHPSSAIFSPVKCFWEHGEETVPQDGLATIFQYAALLLIKVDRPLCMATDQDLYGPAIIFRSSFVYMARKGQALLLFWCSHIFFPGNAC